MLRLFRINTGSCGGCDIELDAAVRTSTDLQWVDRPSEAHLLVLTGPLTREGRQAFLALWRGMADRVPLAVVGRCAIDGYPFGLQGIAGLPEIPVTIKVDGCPPDPAAIAEALRSAPRSAR